MSPTAGSVNHIVSVRVHIQHTYSELLVRTEFWEDAIKPSSLEILNQETTLKGTLQTFRHLSRHETIIRGLRFCLKSCLLCVMAVTFLQHGFRWC